MTLVGSSVERLPGGIDLSACAAAACAAVAPRRMGRVARVVGLTFEVEGLEAAIGDVVRAGAGDDAVMGEVVAVGRDGLVAMPLDDLHGLRAGAPVCEVGGALSVPVGHQLLGRVIDGLGRPLDDGPPLDLSLRAALAGDPPHPLRRPNVDQPVHLGVRALDTLVPVGRGQRIGIFAGSGVGKSSLMSMIVRGTDADISVVALVGERGREVREFIERDLGPEGLARSVVVVATSDTPALVRLRSAFAATRIAEWFRDEGCHVNLLMDSLTRFAMAQREIGLSAGEVPATRGYPPSVFALLPRLLERAGASEHGSITGIYTVLVEADDLNDPIGDSARSILDGHVALSRRLATEGHFPTIDVLESISRVAPAITTPEQRAIATRARRLMAAFREARDLIEIGAYQPGTNPTVDDAVARREDIDMFLRQGMDERSAPGEAFAELAALLGGEVGGVKRYRFRLEQVSRIRQLQEESARVDMLTARQRLIDAGADLSLHAERLESRSLTSSANAHLFRAERHHDELLTLAVTAARAAEANARLLVGRRTEEWTAAAREVSTLERLEARSRAEHAVEADRETQKELDDLVVSRFGRHDGEETRP